jgi:hypothetical protein
VRKVFLLPFLSLALAQVGLLDGPRPPTEVRGTLQGNPRDGYKVAVEFLVDQGVEPLQGTVYQPLSWDGTLYLCPGTCDTFRLSGYTRGALYSQAVFDLYDSQNRFRGRAGVNTVYDAQNRPAYYQVEYAVSPLQGTKVWMPSPDNPVFMEAGGWLSVTPPGGSVRERYRYPGMESYQPPSVQGSILSGLSPGDRDVAAKVLLSSLADLRAFYARQPRGSALWFFVPEVSVWTQTLAQEFGSRNGGQARFVVPENTARAYCTLYRNDSRFHVMPRDTLPKEQSFAVIYPPSGATQKGAVMAGRHLVDRPDWQETDYLSLETALSPTQDGLPEARAYVWGYISQANLKARVQFKDWVLSSGYDRYASGQAGSPWDGRFTADVGRGPETFQLQNWQEGDYSNTIFYAKDDQGRDRAFVYVTTRKETVYELDTSRPTDFSLWTFGGPNGIRFTVAGETFESYDCSLSNWTSNAYSYACSYRDLQGRYRGSGSVVIAAVLDIAQVSGTVYPLVARTRTLGYIYSAYIKGWSQTWRYATDNDRPVEAGGYVTSEGKRYQIPGLEGYLLPTGKDIEAAEGDPYVSYITRSISPGQAPLGGTGRTEAKVWFKPLSDWCREKGL